MLLDFHIVAKPDVLSSLQVLHELGPSGVEFSGVMRTAIFYFVAAAVLLSYYPFAKHPSTLYFKSWVVSDE